MPRSRSTASRATRRRTAPASARSRHPAAGAVRIAEAVGSSERSWDDAVLEAVRGAKRDAPKPIAVEVARLSAELDERGRIRTYRAAVKVAYRVTLVRP